MIGARGGSFGGFPQGMLLLILVFVLLQFATGRLGIQQELSNPVGLIALVGRSFGGRMCALLAAVEPPDALAIVGHPIAPPDRPRPRDEAALAGMRCRTLVVQGANDELGPVAVLERIAGQNPRIDLIVIAGAGHDLGAREREAIDHVARWLDASLR